MSRERSIAEQLGKKHGYRPELVLEWCKAKGDESLSDKELSDKWNRDLEKSSRAIQYAYNGTDLLSA
jgi:hypothetical protein